MLLLRRLAPSVSCISASRWCKVRAGGVRPSTARGSSADQEERLGQRLAKRFCSDGLQHPAPCRICPGRAAHSPWVLTCSREFSKLPPGQGSQTALQQEESCSLCPGEVRAEACCELHPSRNNPAKQRLALQRACSPARELASPRVSVEESCCCGLQPLQSFALSP